MILKSHTTQAKSSPNLHKDETWYNREINKIIDANKRIVGKLDKVN